MSKKGGNNCGEIEFYWGNEISEDDFKTVVLYSDEYKKLLEDGWLPHKMLDNSSICSSKSGDWTTPSTWERGEMIVLFKREFNFTEKVMGL